MPKNDGLMKPVDSNTQTTGETLIDGLKDLAGRKGFWIGVGVFVFLAFLSANDVLEGSVVIVGVFLLYFLPAVIARKKPNASSVFVINLFLGWTLIGWVIALAMAVNDPKPQVVVHPAPAASPAATGRLCPFCAEEIRPAAIVCKHCGRDLPSETA
jgi:hypothetical protein